MAQVVVAVADFTILENNKPQRIESFDYQNVDEAAVLGNSCTSGCYTFDATSASGLLRQLVTTVPGAALIAEPWGVGTGTYQLGSFPNGWSEWNGQFRDGIRTLENKLGVTATPLSALQDEWAGSPSLYASRSPAASVNR